MPIFGRVDGDSRRITVRINVSGDGNEYREMVFEVDTASDAALALSIQEIAELGLAPTGTNDYRSNGTSQDVPRYAAYVEWHDGPILVNVIETDRPAYVGMGLLWDSLLTAYLFPSGAAFVSRMAHWDEIKREAAEE